MPSYGQESPMDFEFQNGTGPIDGRSPFAQISQNQQRFPPGMSNAKKRSYSAFDSPVKPRPNHLSPSKPLPNPPAAFNSLFNTPRKPSADIDDSSAGETPRSPEGRDDSDATPDQRHTRGALARFDNASMPSLPAPGRTSPTKEKPVAARRDSWMVKLKNKVYSPGRGEIPRADYSNAMEKRVEKRRRRDADKRVTRRRRHSMSDSGDDSEQPPSSPRKISGQQATSFPDGDNRPHWITSLFTFIAQHPTVPHILSFYAQLLFNVFLLGACGYMIYCFWSAVQGDVDKKSYEAMADIMAEMAACAEQYTTNRCDRSTRIPAMEALCENWAKCMNRDPSSVGRAKVSAGTFAEIFNSFVEPISYKAMIFTAVLVFGCFAVSNMAFGFFRSNTGNDTRGYQPYFQQPPPPTPQRTFSGQDGNGFYGTPWHHPPVGFEPQPSGGIGQIEGRGSPVRRLAYN